MIKRLFTLVIASFSMITIQPSAFADALCGGSRIEGSNTAMLLDVGSTVTCSVDKKDPVCHISFTVSDHKGLQPDQVKGHSLRLFRRTGKDKWIIYLQTATPLEEMNRMSITVNKNDPMEIPAEFLNFGEKTNKLHAHIDPRLTKVVVDELRKGKTASLTLTYGNPQKKLIAKFDEKTLKGNPKAFDWIDCMQKGQK